MSKLKSYLCAITALFLLAPLFPETFRYTGSKTYIYVERTDLRRYDNGKYSGLDIVDRLDDLGYNLTKYRYASFDDLLYYREGQIVARQIIVLRKK